MRVARARGYTLTELMITLAVVGILAAIAYPNYTRYIVRGSREAAKSELLQLASLQEKIYLNSNSYTLSITSAYNGRSDGGLGNAKGTTSDGKYTLTIATTAGATGDYTITATPVAGKSQASDGKITIASDGTRSWNGSNW